MSKPKSSNSASHLQDEMSVEQAKVEKKYLKLMAPHEKAISKLKGQKEKEISQIEKKYLKMIEELDDIDISFAKAEINTENYGNYR